MSVSPFPLIIKAYLNDASYLPFFSPLSRLRATIVSPTFQNVMKHLWRFPIAASSRPFILAIKKKFVRARQRRAKLLSWKARRGIKSSSENFSQASKYWFFMRASHVKLNFQAFIAWVHGGYTKLLIVNWILTCTNKKHFESLIEAHRNAWKKLKVSNEKILPF